MHLSEKEILFCADSIATDSAAEYVSDKSKKHLKECEECQEKVNNEAEILRLRYRNDIANCLNKQNSSKSNRYWGVIIVIVILLCAILYFVSVKESFYL